MAVEPLGECLAGMNEFSWLIAQSGNGSTHDCRTALDVTRTWVTVMLRMVVSLRRFRYRLDGESQVRGDHHTNAAVGVVVRVERKEREVV